MATKKIKGWTPQQAYLVTDAVTGHSSATVVISTEKKDGDVRCAIVVGDEPVYTASEVLPDIESLLKWVHRVTVYMRECGEARPEAERMVGFMATRYGITLDTTEA